MKRYTAMRTSLIASAVAWPLSVMIFYLTLVYDPPGKYYWLSFCGALMLIQYAPVLCVDPATEIDSAAPRLGKGAHIKAWIIGSAAPLLIYWLLYQPNVRTFLSEIKPLLRDWKPTTVLVLLCLQIMLKRLRKALTFKVTDLYPTCGGLRSQNPDDKTLQSMNHLLICLLLAITNPLMAGSADAVIRGKTESGRTELEVRVDDIEGRISSVKLTIDGESYSIANSKSSPQTVVRDPKNQMYFLILDASGRQFRLWMIPHSE